MIKKIEIQKSSFERYFMEADGDDTKVSVTVAPRKNRGTDYGKEEDGTNVTVAPRSNRGTNYSADDEDELNNKSQNDHEKETPNNNSLPPEEDDGPDTGDGDTDYADDNPDDDSNDEDDDGSDDEPSEEDIKKYNMYRQYLHLYRSIESMIDKIRDVVKNDVAKNAVIKKVTENLTNLTSNMFDFMTVKYATEPYTTIRLYFETSLAVVRLNFKLLSNNKITLS